MLRLLLRLGIALLVFWLGFFVWVLVRTGELRSLEPLAAGRCELVTDAPGAEDLTIHRPSGIAFVSSFDRRASESGESVNGRIFTYELTTRSLSDATPEEPAVFRPHGISLWEGDGELRLFVVNHRGTSSAPEDTVEILGWDGARFRHLETVTGELLISPNDLAAVGPRSFYVTNDHAAASGWRRFTEDALGLARGTVVYYDGESMMQVADRLAYANGIATSRLGREVYVAGTTHGKLYVFARDLVTGALGQPFEIPLGTGVDNIEVDRNGMLWVAAHPKLLRFFRHRLDARKRSPSQVLWVDSDQSVDPPVRPVYLDLGAELSGSSVAAPYGSRLLIGSVYGGFLDCERD